PPLWVGGNSRQAIERAAQLGDGWAPFPNPAELARTTRTARLDTLSELGERIALFHARAAAAGRKGALDVCYALEEREPSAARDRIAELRELGVTWLTVEIGGTTRREHLARLERFAHDVR